MPSSRMVEKNYREMINALTAYASGVEVKVSELQSAATVCFNALTEDEQVKMIRSNLNACVKNYLTLIKSAVMLAQKMQEELDSMIALRRIWEETNQSNYP